MKFLLHSLAIALGLCTLAATLQAELLIVKTAPDGTVQPLDESDDVHSAAISETLLKYQWPMCIARASELSPEEQDELFSPDRPNAEEIFIQKKLREVTGVAYSVIFVPTALYELFCITQVFIKNTTPNPLQYVIENTCRLQSLPPDENHWTITLQATIKSKATARKISQQIANIFTNRNEYFLTNNSTALNPALFINNELTKLLLRCIGSVGADAIQRNSNQLIARCISELEELAHADSKGLLLKYQRHFDRETPNELLKYLLDENLTRIIATTMSLEYEARIQNKALLIRGTSFEELPISTGITPIMATLAGTTLWLDRPSPDDSLDSHEKTPANASQAKPYSISFGNSLFAGGLTDAEACAYFFLNGTRVDASTGSSPHKHNAGYALFIDKMAYIRHQCNNLFFITPLAPIAAIFQNGEFFHSRAKAAIRSKPHSYDLVTDQTISLERIRTTDDPTGVLLITRDPLQHAELFSRFIVDNGRIIQLGDASTLTPEERAFVEAVKVSQVKAAKFYRALRTTTPKVQRAIKKFRQRKLDATERPVAATPDTAESADASGD